MCLLALALGQHPDYPVILIANRDEFHSRPTQPLSHWQQPPGIIAGRDLQAGGTWLGAHTKGRFAALTNVREPAFVAVDAPSRGGLVTDFLTSSLAPDQWQEQLGDLNRWPGFNLLVATLPDRWWYLSNRACARELTPGYYALSNASLDTDWPKTRGLRDDLKRHLAAGDMISRNELFNFLWDRGMPESKELPDTGVGYEQETLLAPRFIVSPDYGTRSSTVLTVHNSGHCELIERTLNASGSSIGEELVSFNLS